MYNSFMDTDKFLKYSHKVFENIPAPIYFIKKDGEIIYINKAFSEFFQIPNIEIIGVNISEFNPSNTFIKDKDLLDLTIEPTYRLINGKKCKFRKFPILNNDGETLGSLGVILFSSADDNKNIIEEYDALLKKLSIYQKELTKHNTAIYDINSIVGESDVISKCKKDAKKMSVVNFNLLITGEKGSGKEMFANVIHNLSDRKDRPFIKIDCELLTEENFDHELFGIEHENKIGKLELSEGGTIFFNEISSLNHNMQTKLLGILQSKYFIRIGGKNHIRVNSRIICSTAKDIYSMVKKGEFREELFYRLNVLSMRIPTLRERKEDILMLSNYFVKKIYNEIYNKNVNKKISQNVEEILENYYWPENIEELKNVIEVICVNCKYDNIKVEHLPKYLLNDSFSGNEAYGGGLNELLNSIEMDIIINCLRECEFNKTEAAKKLKIPRVTLYRKMKQYGIE